MSALMKRIQCDPRFPLIIAGTSYFLLTSVSAACLFYYFTQIVSNDFFHWQLIAYVLMFANGLIGFSEFVDEDSFCPLRDLLDYCQIVLVLPCYAAEMWIKTEMGPSEVSAIHAGLGFMAAAIYVMMEYRRQDLTDLAVFGNTVSLGAVGILSGNPLTILALMVFVSGYVFYKRKEDQCCLAPQDKFNFVMAFFSLVTLGSFDEGVMSAIHENIDSGLQAIGAA